MPSKDLIIARPVSLICRGIAPLSALTGLLSLRENPLAAFAADLQPDSREFSAPPPNQPTGSLLRRRPSRLKCAGQARRSRTKNEHSTREGALRQAVACGNHRVNYPVW